MPLVSATRGVFPTARSVDGAAEARCDEWGAGGRWDDQPVFDVVLAVRSAWWRLGSWAATRHYRGRLLLARGSRVRGPYNLTVVDEGRLSIGADTVVDQRVMLTARGRLTIGRACFLGVGTVVGCESSVTIGDRVAIAPYCVILDTGKKFEDVSKPIVGQGRESRPVVIEDDVWLGAGVAVMPGVTIGAHTVVGAGSVVTRSLPSYVVAAGAPATIIRSISRAAP